MLQYMHTLVAVDGDETAFLGLPTRANISEGNMAHRLFVFSGLHSHDEEGGHSALGGGGGGICSQICSPATKWYSLDLIQPGY